MNNHWTKKQSRGSLSSRVPCEQLIVCSVHWVSALEHDHIRVGRKHSPDLCRSLAGENTLGQLKSHQLSAEVGLTTLPGHHLDTRVLQRARLVALEGLLDLWSKVCMGRIEAFNGAAIRTPFHH